MINYKPIKTEIKWNIDHSMQSSRDPSLLSLFVNGMLIEDVWYDMVDDIDDQMRHIFHIIIGGFNGF